MNLPPTRVNTASTPPASPATVPTNPWESCPTATTTKSGPRTTPPILHTRVKQVNENPFYDEDGDGRAQADEGDQHTLVYPNLENRGLLRVAADDKYHLAAGEYLYDRIEVEGSGQLILDGDVTLWVTTSVRCAGNSWTNYVEDSMYPDEEQAQKSEHILTIYMPPVVVDGGGSVNQTADISGRAHFNGFIYAPGANCKITGNSEAYGMIVGETVTTTGSTEYDPDSGAISWPTSATIDFALDNYGG